MTTPSLNLTVSEFLAKRVGSLIARIEELEANRDEIFSAPEALEDPLFSEAFIDIVRGLVEKFKELNILEETQRYIRQDIGEQLESDFHGSSLGTPDPQARQWDEKRI